MGRRDDRPATVNAANTVHQSTVHGLVQAGAVHGGISFHEPPPPRRRVNPVYVVIVVVALVAGGLGVGRLVRSWSRASALAIVADYQPEIELPAAVYPGRLGPHDFPNDQGCRSVVRWTVANGGTFASGTPVRLSMHNQGGTAVVNRIAIQVTDRQPAPDGTALSCDSSGSPPVRLVVDLDAQDPVARREGTGALAAVDTVAELQDEATQTVDIIPMTENCLCRWRIVVEYTSQGEHRAATVLAPGDTDFRTAAMSRVSHRYSTLNQDGPTAVWVGS